MQAVKSTKVLFVSRVSQARVYRFYWSNLLRRSLSGMKQLLQCDGPKKKKKKNAGQLTVLVTLPLINPMA